MSLACGKDSPSDWTLLRGLQGNKWSPTGPGTPGSVWGPGCQGLGEVKPGEVTALVQGHRAAAEETVLEPWVVSPHP